MDELISVDRGDGLAIAGLLTSLVAHWDDIPLAVQAAMIDRASAAAFDKLGRTDGRYVVTAFVLKQRAAFARRARKPSLGARLRGSLYRIAGQPRRVIDGARSWQHSRWLTALRKVA